MNGIDFALAAALAGWLIYGEDLMQRAHDLVQGAVVWLDARYPNTERGVVDATKPIRPDDGLWTR